MRGQWRLCQPRCCNQAGAARGACVRGNEIAGPDGQVLDAWRSRAARPRAPGRARLGWGADADPRYWRRRRASPSAAPGLFHARGGRSAAARTDRRPEPEPGPGGRRRRPHRRWQEHGAVVPASPSAGQAQNRAAHQGRQTPCDDGVGCPSTSWVAAAPGSASSTSRR
jgi:hypothetical protein